MSPLSPSTDHGLPTHQDPPIDLPPRSPNRAAGPKTETLASSRDTPGLETLKASGFRDSLQSSNIPFKSRFLDDLVDTTCWNPDSVPQPRFHVADRELLESRGITPQKGESYDSPPAKPAQQALWKANTIHKFSISSKLRQIGRNTEADKLELCHSFFTVCQCTGCGKVERFPNRCDNFFCPECQPGLSWDRRREVEWWVAEVQSPWHVCVTVKNTRDLTAGHIREFRAWWTNLRRRRFAKAWRGGFYSIEVTNEKKGWHLHLHAFVDAPYIDQYELGRQWQKVTKGMGRICWAKRASGDDFIHEVSKYVVKGNSLAKWDSAQIATFIDAFTGSRTFGVFGSLYGKRTQFAEFIAELKSNRKTCDCGCTKHRYYSEAEWLIHELEGNGPAPARPPPATENDFPAMVVAHYVHD